MATQDVIDLRDLASTKSCKIHGLVCPIYMVIYCAVARQQTSPKEREEENTLRYHHIDASIQEALRREEPRERYVGQSRNRRRAGVEWTWLGFLAARVVVRFLSMRKKVSKTSSKQF